MRQPSPHLLTPCALLLLANAWLLAGCSSPAPTISPADADVEAFSSLPSRFPFGILVDCQNGLPGHSFGEPLDSFPKMRPIPPAPGDLTQGYVLAGPTRWYGQHRTQIRGLHCYFLDNQFYRFRTVADGAMLRPESIELFGSGQAQGLHRIVWEGYRARAVYSETPTPGGFEGQLEVVSKFLEDTLAAKTQAQLQATNSR